MCAIPSNCSDFFPVNIEALREAYQQAAAHEPAVKKLFALLPAQADALAEAYRAAGHALKGRYAWNPMTKLQEVQACLKLFEQAVAQAPDNPEIRFLRFTILHHLPEFLQDKDALASDRETLLARLPYFQDYGLNREHLRGFLRFFEESKRFSGKELDPLYRLLPQ